MFGGETMALASSNNNALAATPLVPPKTTTLPPELEKMYRGWVLQNKIPQSRDYDMRGFFVDLLMGSKDAQTGVDPSDLKLHFTDKWKLPGHPSFSSESVYSRTAQDPRWVENPAPYKEGTWARRNKTGNLNVDIPFPDITY